jgi:transposase
MMTKPYPMEMRERAVGFVKAGQSRHAVAERLGVSVSCTVKWLLRRKATGSVKPGKIGGHVKPTISDAHRDWVLDQVAAGGDVTLQGLTDGLGRRGVKVDYHTMWNFMKREGKSYKKTAYGDEQTRPDVARKRVWWRKYLTRIDITRMVFIDETWTKTNMTPLRGWGNKGKRLIGRAPHGRWKTLTFLAALRVEGVTAPRLLSGPINSESFLIYVRDVLLPTLRPGDIVVMDNLGSHKANVIRNIGARLVFLPPRYQSR